MRVAERVGAGSLITVGGIGTIVAVTTICVFLVWVVVPLFRRGGSVEPPREAAARAPRTRPAPRRRSSSRSTSTARSRGRSTTDGVARGPAARRRRARRRAATCFAGQADGVGVRHRRRPRRRSASPTDRRTRGAVRLRLRAARRPTQVPESFRSSRGRRRRDGRHARSSCASPTGSSASSGSRSTSTSPCVASRRPRSCSLDQAVLVRARARSASLRADDSLVMRGDRRATKNLLTDEEKVEVVEREAALPRSGTTAPRPSSCASASGATTSTSPGPTATSRASTAATSRSRRSPRTVDLVAGSGGDAHVPRVHERPDDARRRRLRGRRPRLVRDEAAGRADARRHRDARWRTSSRAHGAAVTALRALDADAPVRDGRRRRPRPRRAR